MTEQLGKYPFGDYSPNVEGSDGLVARFDRYICVCANAFSQEEHLRELIRFGKSIAAVISRG
jgi:hypothetical protein